MNRILVIGDENLVSPQTRTYAEYRVFAIVARHTRRVRRVRIVLTRNLDARRDELRCAVTVDLDSSPVLRVRAKGSHIYMAINRAVERLGAAMDRRFEQRRTS
jgi:ribosomal subunit interface protein